MAVPQPVPSILPAGTAPLAAAPQAAAAAPAPDQLRPAFAAAASPGGPNRLIVRLDPAELGRVEVGILRRPDGPARVELTAERPETLQLLMRDQPALHRALDLAGIPAEGRTLHFQAAHADPARDAAPAPPSSSQPMAQSGTGSGGPSSGMGGSMAGNHGGGSHPGGGRAPPGWSGPSVPDGRDALPASLRPARASRAGVDITA